VRRLDRLTPLRSMLLAGSVALDWRLPSRPARRPRMLPPRWRNLKTCCPASISAMSPRRVSTLRASKWPLPPSGRSRFRRGRAAGPGHRRQERQRVPFDQRRLCALAGPAGLFHRSRRGRLRGPFGGRHGRRRRNGTGGRHRRLLVAVRPDPGLQERRLAGRAGLAEAGGDHHGRGR